MFIDARNQLINWQKARLISPVQTKTSGSCLHFYYHAYGKNIGQLNVYSKVGGSLNVPIWTVLGEQGNE